MNLDSDIYLTQSKEYILSQVKGANLLQRQNTLEALHLDQTAMLVWQLCDGTRTAGALVEELSALYPDERHMVAKDVNETLDMLHSHGVILAIPYKYEFSICAIFHNEATIIKQWIEHHILFGCQHFYLINNNSTDSSVSILGEYIEQGLVSLVDEPRPYRQHYAYDEYYLSTIRQETRWIGIIDIDEYLYPRNSDGDIRRVLESNDEVDALAIPWLIFGSSGHIAQPDSIVESFVDRCDFDKRGWTSFKTLARTASLANALSADGGTTQRQVLGIHSQRLKSGSNFIPSFSPVDTELQGGDMPYCYYFNEEKIQNAQLVINHYAIMSLDYFKNEKLPRKSASTPEYDDAKSGANFFEKEDYNDIEDRTLVKLTEALRSK